MASEINKTKRITILIDVEIDRKLRIIQAGKIKKENCNVSYSKVINNTLRRNLK